MEGWHRALGAGELEEGRPRLVEVAGRLVVVALVGGELVAVDGQCPHKFGDLSQGTWKAGCVTCPVHDATFDCATGAPKPGSEWAGHLPVHEVRINDGNVEVRLNG